MSAVEKSPFTRRALAWVLGICVVSFVGALLLGVFGAELERVPSAGSDAYSKSALGHHALVRLLTKSGVPVVLSRHDSGLKAKAGALLCLFEPVVHGTDTPRAKVLRETLDQAEGPVLLALPKREGHADPLVKSKLDEVWLRDVEDAEEVLTVSGISATVIRIAPEADPAWDENDVGVAPTTTPPLQLLSPTSSVDPLIRAQAGILLGETWVGDTRVVVLSDPDLLANHGLGDGENAALALGLIDSLRPPGGAVILDETLHGYELEPTIWREMFEFPLVLALAQAVLTLLILLWAAMGRFGAPLPTTGALEPGKSFLIGNIAELLRYGGHAGHALSRYLQTTLMDLGRLLHAPPSVGPGELRAWLGRVGVARGVKSDVKRLEEEVAAASAAPQIDEKRVALLAARIHRWRQEMIDGSGTHPAG